MPKSKPIIFDGYSVQAILNGQKTQVRKIIKPQPDYVTACGEPIVFKTIETINHETHKIEIWSHVPGEPESKYCDVIECPYKVGDLLWVRETWHKSPYGIFYKADWDRGWGEEDTSIIPLDNDSGDKVYQVDQWKSPATMPCAASRITIEITGVRVERLHNISESDAISEGIKQFDYGLDPYALAQGKDVRNYFYGVQELAPSCMETTAKEAYRRWLWQPMNKKHPWDSNPWDSNPWVWVIEFTQIPAPDKSH